MATPVLNTFNAGELSDYLSARTDLQKYRNGCQILENMLVLPYGGVERRPGTEFIAEVKDSADNTRLIPFERSEDTSFVLEFGDYYIRFYTDGGQVEADPDAYNAGTAYVVGDMVVDVAINYICIQDGTGQTPASSPAYWTPQDIYEIASPYAEDEVWDLKFAQSADVIYFVHPLYPPHKLSRLGQAEWTIEEVVFVYEAFMDENTETADTVTPTNTGGDNYNLVSSISDFFVVDDVDGNFLLKFPRADNAIQEVFNSAGIGSNEMRVFGDWNFVTHGTWTGTVQLQRSFNNGASWQQYRTYSSTGDRNIDASGTEEIEDVLYRIECTAYTSGTITCDLNVNDYFDRILFLITGYTSGTTVTATRISGDMTDHDTESTPDWAWGSWSPKNGYPETIAFYEERLIFSTTSAQPQTVWTSKTGDYENLTSGSLDDSALIYTISSDRVNKILWMVPQTSLMIGTDGGEWKMWSGKRDEPLTPTNVSFKRQSTYGSESIQAILINDVIMYVQRGSRKLREMTYSYEREVFVSPDMSILAEHVTETGIVDMVFQQNPHPIVWFVRTDGQLIGFTYEASQEVVGWHRHPMENGIVESLASISSLPEDEVWMIVKRTIDGNDVRYVERMKPVRFGNTNLDAWFVDSALEFNGGDPVVITGATKADPCVLSIPGHSLLDGQQIRITNVVGMTQLNKHVFTVSNPAAGTIELRDENDTGDINSTGYGTYVSGGQALRVEKDFGGLDHLEGQTVAALVDGAVVDDTTVSGGSAELETYGNKIVIGLAYTSTVKPMNIESDLADGGSQARKKRISQVAVRFYKTTGAVIEADAEEVENDPEEMVVAFRKAADPMDTALPLFSGDKKVFYKDGFDNEAGITIKQELALPMTILMISPWIKNFN